MTTILSKGANTSVSNVIPDGKLIVGFSWDVIISGKPGVEVVPCALLCGADGNALNRENLVFFNQMESPDENVIYSQDVVGDDEQLEINLLSIPEEVHTIVFVLYANPTVDGTATLTSLRSSSVRVLNRSGQEKVKYSTTNEDSNQVAALHLAELYRRNGEWKIRAVGQGYEGGIMAVAQHFRFTL